MIVKTQPPILTVSDQVMDSAEVLKNYGDLLTPYEKKEIQEYRSVYDVLPNIFVDITSANILRRSTPTRSSIRTSVTITIGNYNT